MNFDEALRLLDKIAPGDFLWKRHSQRVAQVAFCISQSLSGKGEELDPPSLRASALFHDVGRYKTHGPLHGWVGYILLRKHGLEAYSRGCIVHWLKGRTQEEVLADGLLSARFVRRLYQKFNFPHLSLGDKILALSDALVMHDRVVSLDARYEDLQQRYGPSPWLDRHQEFSRLYQEEIEKKLGVGLAKLFEEALPPLGSL